MLGADFDDDPKKSELRVIEKLVASNRRRQRSPRRPRPQHRRRRVQRAGTAHPRSLPERLYVLYQKEQPFDGLMLGPPYQGVVPRSATASAAVERFLAVVTKSGLRESEVTRAIFEGRLSVERAALPGRYFNFQRVVQRSDDPNLDYALLRAAAGSPPGK